MFRFQFRFQKGIFEIISIQKFIMIMAVATNYSSRAVDIATLEGVESAATKAGL